ncbi:c-type cytochrome biogenesis protein CcmI [Vreelandella sp. EE22]
MTPLWIAMAVVALPALWLMLAPLWRARALHEAQRRFSESDDANQQNVAIFKRRLVSLENARARSDIDQARFEEDRLELERSLLDDTTAAPVRRLKAPDAGRLAVPLVAVLGLGACVFGYQQNGAEGDLALYALRQSVENDPERSVDQYRERLETEAARQPRNPNVWGSLFTLYRETGELDKAANALNRLIEIQGRAPTLLGELAELHFFMAGRRFTPKVQALVDEAREQDPRQPKVLSLLGIQAFDDGDYARAIDRWRRALAGLEDPATIDALREGIRIAQARMNEEER